MRRVVPVLPFHCWRTVFAMLFLFHCWASYPAPGP